MGNIAKYFVFLMAMLLMACSHAEQRAAIPAGATVLVLGDSISYGTGANSGEDYPSLLAAKTGWNIVNAGVPGDTSAMGLERLPGLLEANQPKLVLVELGGNDFLRHIPRDQTIDNLKKILALIKAKQVPAVILGIPKASLFGAAVGSLSDDEMFADLAKETDNALITGALAEVLEQSDLKADPIHPNAQGYQKLAELLAKSLKAQGFLH